MPRAFRSPLCLAVLLVLALLSNAVYRAGFGSKLRTDLTVYRAGSAAALAGKDPFGAQNERGWPYVYPPTFAVLMAPLQIYPLPLAAAQWFLASVAALVAGVWGFRRALADGGPGGPFSWREDGIPLALILLPSASALLRGQVAPLLLGLLGLAAGLLAQRRELLAALLIALATAIKLTPGLVIVGLLVARRGKAAGACALGLTLWLLLVPLPLLGPEATVAANRSFAERMVLRYLHDPASHNLQPGQRYELNMPRNQSPAAAILYRTEGTPRTLLLGILVLGVLGSALAACARGPRAPNPAAYALLLAAPLLVAPAAWHHYHPLLYPLLAVLARARQAPSARRALIAFALLSGVHFAVPPARPWCPLGLGTLIVFASGLAQALRWARDE